MNIYIYIYINISIPHRIHVWYIYIYANIWGILMVNVTIYSIHGSYGYWLVVSTLWKIRKSLGMIIPNIWKNKKQTTNQYRYWKTRVYHYAILPRTGGYPTRCNSHGNMMRNRLDFRVRSFQSKPCRFCYWRTACIVPSNHPISCLKYMQWSPAAANLLNLLEQIDLKHRQEKL